MHLSAALQEIGQLDLEASGLHEVLERLIESYGFIGRPIVLGVAVKEISHPVESILYLAFLTTFPSLSSVVQRTFLVEMSIPVHVGLPPLGSDLTIV